jgi:multidrug efflux system outer membrane protein
MPPSGARRISSGRPSGSISRPQASDVPMPKPNETLDAYVKRALDARPDLRSARKQQEAADLAIDDAWFRFAPSLGITWALTWTPQTTTFQPNATQWQAIATLSIPFFDGGARYGALRDAKAALKQAEERVVALKRSIRNDVRDAARRVETASRGFEFAQRSVEVARVAAEQAEAAYQAGTVTGIELDDSREAQEEAEVTAILRALERELAVVDLVAALGDADAAKKKR